MALMKALEKRWLGRGEQPTGNAGEGAGLPAGTGPRASDPDWDETLERARNRQRRAGAENAGRRREDYERQRAGDDRAGAGGEGDRARQARELGRRCRHDHGAGRGGSSSGVHPRGAAGAHHAASGKDRAHNGCDRPGRAVARPYDGDGAGKGRH